MTKPMNILRQFTDDLFKKLPYSLMMVSTFLIFPITNGYSLELRSYYIECDPDEFAYIIAHPNENDYIDCSFEFNNNHWDNVRIRLRGESSRLYPKKSFKVNFDADERFFGRDKINLISEYMDSSFCREFLAYDFYRRAGLPASRTCFARLYVNDRYMGLYLDVEQLDEHFLRMTNLSNDASIYKADGNGSILRSTDRLDGVMWQKETNQETGFYDLARLIEWLDSTPESRFFIDLEKFFNPEELARVIAVNGILANTSTYYHNYFLIHTHSQNGRWQMLPWDMDVTFYYRYNYGVPQFYECGQAIAGTNILIIKCWRDPQMRELIFEQMCGLVDSVFVDDYFEAMSDTLEELLLDAVNEDSLKQYSTEQFLRGVRAFPELVAGRGVRVLEKMEHYAVPFDLKPPVLTPDGIFFSWDSTFVPDESDIYYDVVISESVWIPGGGDEIIENIDDTLYLHDEIEPGDYYYRVRAVTPDDKKTYCLNYNSPFTIPEGAFDATVVRDTITESTTWTMEDSPYSLPDGLVIAPGAVLTIEPGVLVGLGGWKDIVVEGGLTISGSRSDSVYIVPLNPAGRWRYIEVVEPTHPVRMNFVNIYRGYCLIRCHGGRLEVFDSKFSAGHWAASTHNTDVHFERVHFEDFLQENVYTSEASTIIRSCVFKRGPQPFNTGDLIDLNDLENALVERCLFYTACDEAIDLDRVNNARVINNRISGLRDHGISMNGWRLDIYLANNIITDCNGGIKIRNLSGTRLYNNVIAFCDTGITVDYYVDNGGTAYVRNTVLWRNGFNVYLGEDAEIDVAYSMVDGDEPYPGDGNLTSNPHFIDQWDRNFDLTERSSLIDAGYGTDHPPLDFYDGPRNDVPDVRNTGSGNIRYVDIGAFEYGSNRFVEPEPELPESYTYLVNYPNPFNSMTRIDFQIMRGTVAVIEIFNVRGRRVFKRNFGKAVPGGYSMLWDGRSDTCMNLASGIYFCRLTHAAGVRTIKMVLVR